MSPQTQVRTYKSPAEYRADAEKAAKAGWFPINVTEHRPRAGCMRILLLWWWTLFFPPKPQLVVTYQRGDPPHTNVLPPTNNVPLAELPPSVWSSSQSKKKSGIGWKKGFVFGLLILVGIVVLSNLVDSGSDTVAPTATRTPNAQAGIAATQEATKALTSKPTITATAANKAISAKTPTPVQTQEATKTPRPKPTKTPKPKQTATKETTAEVISKGGDSDGGEAIHFSEKFQEGSYAVDASCTNTAMQVYVFEEDGDPNNPVLVTWPVSRSRLNEASTMAVFPRTDTFLVEVWCDGLWSVQFIRQ